MNIIIPIGGKGERFKNAGYALPKPLIKVFDKTIIEYLLDNLNTSIDDDVYIIYNHNLDFYGFSDFIHKKYPHIHLIKISIQTKGASETILLGSEIITFRYKHTMVLDCDTFYTEDVVSTYRNNTHKNVVFYREVCRETPPIYSYIKVENKKIKDIAEKVKISNKANTGIYCFEDIHTLLEYIHKVLSTNDYTSEPYTSFVIKRMLKEDISFYPIEISSCISLGTPEEVDQFMKS